MKRIQILVFAMISLFTASVVSIAAAQAESLGERLVELTETSSLYVDVFKSTEEIVKQNIMAEGLTKSQADIFWDLFLEEFENSQADMGLDIAKSYDDRFTQAELTEMVAFYESETGQKFVSAQTELTMDQARIYEKYVTEAATRTSQRMFASS